MKKYKKKKEEQKNRKTKNQLTKCAVNILWSNISEGDTVENCSLIV